MNNAVLQWKEDFERSQRLGEGRSRTSSEKSELFELMIWIGGQGAMRDLIRAESLQQAIQSAGERLHQAFARRVAQALRDHPDQARLFERDERVTEVPNDLAALEALIRERRNQ